MCKVWPGLRCSDHPQQKLQKLGVALHRAEQSLSYIEENKKLIFKKDGTTRTKDLNEEQAAEERKIVTANISNIQTRIDLEQCGYAMSAGGRKHYQEIVDNPQNGYAARMEAATVLNAALERINDQKDMAGVLKDETLTEEDKDLYLHLQETEQEKRIAELEREKEAIQQKLAKTNQDLTDVVDAYKKQQLTKEREELIVQNTTVNEKLKQRKALKAEIAKHRAAKRQRIQSRFDKTAVQFRKLLTFLLQPARPVRY
mgnify:CR=1 FL=1